MQNFFIIARTKNNLTTIFIVVIITSYVLDTLTIFYLIISIIFYRKYVETEHSSYEAVNFLSTTCTQRVQKMNRTGEEISVYSRNNIIR